MASFNKVILIGNLTRDPQLSYLPSQTAVCEIGLAVNNRWRDRDGQQRESTCFIDCRMFGKRAEVLNQYMAKGQPLLVEGRLEFDQWETQDGQKRSKHRVMITDFTFLGAVGGRDGNSGGGYRQGGAPARQAQGGYNSGPDNDYPPPDAMDEPAGEDIPF